MRILFFNGHVSLIELNKTEWIEKPGGLALILRSLLRANFRGK